MGKLVKQLELDSLVLPLLGPPLLLTLILTYDPCLMSLFSKFLQRLLQGFNNGTIHKLLLTQIIRNVNPTQILLTHIPAFSYLTRHDTPVPQEVVTED